MIVNELHPDLPLTTEFTYTHISRDGIQSSKTEEILNEHALVIQVNGCDAFSTVCLPQYLTELVLGRLCSEGIIASSKDVKEINISEDGHRATVELVSSKADTRNNINDHACDNMCANPCADTCKNTSDYSGEMPIDKRKLKNIASIDWRPEWIFSLADRFAEGMPLHEKTWATHSCLLAIQDKLLFDCEDIGRHNALDKVIGYAIRNDIPLNQCIIYSSGRVPLDMCTKAIQAGIPVYASKAAPTQEAIETAHRYNLTLICAARRDRMKLF